jgi:hypothetical protein
MILVQFSPNNSKGQFKKILEIKVAYVINYTAETNVKNHIYHYTTPCETVICDSDGVTCPHITSIGAI